MISKVEEMLIKMIKSIYLFSSFSDEEILDIAKDFKLEYVPSSTVLIKEGEIAPNIFIFKSWSGEVRKGFGLKKVVLWTVGPGSIVGEMSLLTGKPAVASVVVKTDAEVWQIGRDKFLDFLNKHPHIKEEIQKIVSQRQKTNEEKLKQMESSVDSSLNDLDLNIYL